MATASLLIPCYNAANFLPRLWETVRAQSLPFDELICYDDCSTDETSSVAASLGAKVIRGDRNVGPALARNCLWQAARGDWVHFHDADDLLHPHFVEKMTARAGTTTDVVICDADWQHEDQRRTFLQWRYSEAELLPDPAAYLLAHPVGGINGLYRRAILEKVGGFNSRLLVWEDADLHIRLALAGARFRVVAEPLVVALRRNDSVSAPLARNWLNRLSALEDYAKLPATSAFASALSSEAERAAAAFALLGEPDSAKLALALCHRLGIHPPTSPHLVMQILRRLVPPVTLLRWQGLWRARLAAQRDSAAM